MNAPKEDISKIYTWKILDALNEMGADEYERCLAILREYRTKVEEEFTERNKRQSTFDEHDYNNGHATGLEKVDAGIEERHLPEIPPQADSNQVMFEKPDEIAEL